MAIIRHCPWVTPPTLEPADWAGGSSAEVYRPPSVHSPMKRAGLGKMSVVLCFVSERSQKVPILWCFCARSCDVSDACAEREIELIAGCFWVSMLPNGFVCATPFSQSMAVAEWLSARADYRVWPPVRMPDFDEADTVTKRAGRDFVGYHVEQTEPPTLLNIGGLA